MSKLNQSVRKEIEEQATEFTFEGGKAFKKDQKTELYQLVCSCLLGENTFYEDSDTRRARILTLVEAIVDSDGFAGVKFVANLAVYARSEMHMRTVSIFLVAALASIIEKGPLPLRDEVRKSGLIRRATCDVIQRADELREMLAAAKGFAHNGKLGSASKAIKKGIADAFAKFDTYDFAKYRGGSGAIGMADAIRIVRPFPATDLRNDLYKAIRQDTLTPSETWETVISAEGQRGDQANFQAAWISVLPKMGYMALLRNLNNLQQYGVLDNPEHCSFVGDQLSNRERVLRSKQLPFRFLSAHKAFVEKSLDPNPYILKALEDAFEVSCEQVPNLGNCVVLVDTSGSMQASISGRSKMCLAEAAGCLAAILWKSQMKYGHKVGVYQFADRAAAYNPSANTMGLEFANQIMKSVGEVGFGTVVGAGLSLAEQKSAPPDYLFIFSDMQCADDVIPFFKRGSRLRANNPKIYSVDLAGYQNTPFSVNQGIFQLAGFSDKLFSIVNALGDPDGAVKKIAAMD